jgi:rhodanese-related sulfurtransferase
VIKQPIILVTEIGWEESVTRLSRVGFDNLIGHLDGGFESWEKRQKKLTRSTESPQRVFKRSRNWESKVIDVRKDTEYSAEHVEEAFSKPCSINDWIKDIDPKEPFSCTVQEDTSMIASILQARVSEISKKLKVGLTLLPKQNYLKLILYVKQKIL